MSGNIHVLSNQLVYEEVRHRPHQAEHQVSRNPRADDFDIYRRGAQDEPQQIHDDESNQGDSCDENIAGGSHIGLKSHIRLSGVLIKSSTITSCDVSTPSSAGLKKPVGLDLRWDTALRDLQIQLELIRNTLMKTTTARRQPTASRHLILISSDSNM